METLQQKMKGLFLLVALIAPVFSYGADVTICVMKSDGTPLSGVAATYYAVYGYGMGNTDANGYVTKTIANGTYDFKVVYRGTQKTVTATVSGTDTLRFYTTALTVTVQSCSATKISGVAAKYQPAGAIHQYWIGGNTNAAGETTDQLFPGTCDVTAQYAGTAETKTNIVIGGDGLTPSATASVMFNPTTVLLNNAGSKTYKSGAYSYHANGTIYMFPGTYEFTFPGGYKGNLTISGCSINATVNILVLKDHANNPLAGGTARGGNGASFSSWHVSGSTNADGILFDVRSSAPATMSYEMKFNNTTATIISQDVTANNVFNFKTNKLTLKLETCGGTPLAGGTARYGNGATFGSWFFPAPNSTDVNGESSAEFFPGTYSFEMNINSSREVKSSVVISNADTTLTWKTTTLTLNWAHSISYGGSGDSRFFNKPSMELLPGTLNFNFRAPGANNYIAITVEGCSLSMSPGMVKLVNSANAPLSGGIVDGYEGGWSNYGTTGADGSLFVIDKNPIYLRMTYAGGTMGKFDIDFSVNPVVTFQTITVTMELKDGNNNPLEGENLKYFASGWKTFGSGVTTGGTETMELLPIEYSFRLTHLGATKQVSGQDVGDNPLVSYQTVPVTLTLKDLAGNPIAGGIASFYSGTGSYEPFGTTDANGETTLELFQQDYSFKMIFGAKYDVEHGVTIPATVDFVYDGTWNFYRTIEEGEFNNAPGIGLKQEGSEVSDEDMHSVKVYPNPASQKLMVTFYSDKAVDASAMVTDITGKILARNKVSVSEGYNVHSVDVSDLPAGLYMLMFENINGKPVKIVVQH